MQIVIPTFEDGGQIPERYSKDGGDKSPPVHIEGVPEDAESLVLIMDDPDAPKGTFTHWLLFNIAPTRVSLPENVQSHLLRAGQNDYGENGYGGPKPPSGEHRYFFKLHALDTALSLANGVSRAELEKAMNGHIIAQAHYMGRFAAPEGASCAKDQSA